jgi:hypothetical protein
MGGSRATDPTSRDGSPGQLCRVTHGAGIDIIEVPLDDPSEASYLRFEMAGDPMENEHHSCHDTGVILGHSAGFTWDGEVLIVGHEPGGGSGANCEATDNPLERTFFFLEARTDDSIGRFTIPRPQTSVENCTTHNYNVVPMKAGKGYVMVSGNYQSGISVIDLSDPRTPRRSRSRIRHRSSTRTRRSGSSSAARADGSVGYQSSSSR